MLFTLRLFFPADAIPLLTDTLLRRPTRPRDEEYAAKRVLAAAHRATLPAPGASVVTRNVITFRRAWR